MNPNDQSEQQMQREIEQRRVDTENEMWAILNPILKKESKDMTDTEKGFLRARRSYLSKAQLEEFADVISEESGAPKELENYTRGELEEKAVEVGIEDPSKKNYRTNQDLIEAIRSVE